MLPCSCFMLIILILLHLKCGPEKSSFQGLSGPFPYPYTSNQKRIETPLPLHVSVRNGGVGVRGRNGIGPMSLTLLLCFGNQHFKAPCSILAKSEQHRILLQVIGILTTAFSVILHGLLHLRLLQHQHLLVFILLFCKRMREPGNARSCLMNSALRIHIT